ncbi:MAG: DUF547 domain-containing protein [Burkholderiaceae bacterium]
MMTSNLLVRKSPGAFLRQTMTVAALTLALVFGLFQTSAKAANGAFDHGYPAFTELLGKYVAWNAKGTATAVDYAGFKKDRAALGKVLARMSAVTQTQFDSFSRDEQLVFLINAYNAFTVELILTEYPDLDSIKDLGSLFSSPWSKDFFELLGEKRTLDWVEHTQIRESGKYKEPRIHFVVNCASIGCPALRPEALTPETLEASLEDSTKRFFNDKTRNYYDASDDELKVTKLLDWYEGDFTQGDMGINSREQFLARYAAELSDDPAVQARIKDGKIDIDFTDYDWALNKR